MALGKTILPVLDGLGDRPILALGDLTPLEAAHTPNLDALAAHSAGPVPILFAGAGTRPDAIGAFGERECSHGRVGHIDGSRVMPQVANIMGMTAVYGA